MLLWVLSGILLRSFSSGEVLDGTSMSGIPLGGETRASAARVIAEIKPNKSELSAEDETITVRAPEAGLVIDDESSADEAYSAGRSGLGAIVKGPLVMFGEREVEPVYEPVNEKRLNRTVKRIASQVDREPFVGALTIDSETLAVTTQLPEAGLLVEREQTATDLIDTLRAGKPTMQIPLRRQAAPSQAELEAVANDAEAFLSEPLQVKSKLGNGEITPAELSAVLAVESAGEDAAAGIRLGADREKVESLVAGFAESRDRPAQDAGINAPALPPVNLTEQGDLTWEPKTGAATARKARTGRLIEQGVSVDNVIAAIETDSHQIVFPSEKVDPEVTDRAAQKATSLLGTFTTSFTCCEPRVTNIQQMAKTVDGTVIGPGEQFSLNGVAGERTTANGYKNAPTIGENNELINTIGGGVSQFSTTTYNAAYFAGLQIDSHTPHSFYIDRYPAGRESTLDFGSIDLLWTNDTDAPVVVRSSASDTAVTVSIYGDNGGRRVSAKTQSRTDDGDGGFQITIDRVIVDGNGNRTSEPFTTTYGVPAK